uniref:Uncharacterized protein n=1 Tax=Anopheles dirus TaxID=7168 RepID=A0A182NNL6_9DIPT
MEVAVLEGNKACLQRFQQDFMVSAIVYKARHLVEFNCDTFVMVSCNETDFFPETILTTTYKEYDTVATLFRESSLLARNILFVSYMEEKR